MTQSKFCQQCDQKNKCQETYKKLGKTKGPSVALKAVIAFLLPISVFIVTLAVFEKILAEVIETKQLRTALVFALALSVTLAVILINKKLKKNK